MSNECSICLSVFNELNLCRVLCCGHSFCELCIFKVLMSNNCTCPTCRHLISYKSLAEVPRNYAVQAMAEALTKYKRRMTKEAGIREGDLQAIRSKNEARNEARNMKNLRKSIFDLQVKHAAVMKQRDELLKWVTTKEVKVLEKKLSAMENKYSALQLHFVVERKRGIEREQTCTMASTFVVLLLLVLLLVFYLCVSFFVWSVAAHSLLLLFVYLPLAYLAAISLATLLAAILFRVLLNNRPFAAL